MLTLLDGVLFDGDGTKLKTLNCPLNVRASQLYPRSDGHFNCSSCDRIIINSLELLEQEIVKALQENPDHCIAISAYHPDIKIVG